MAAINDYNSYLASIAAPAEEVPFYLSNITSSVRNLMSVWTGANSTPGAGAAPTTAAVPTSTVAGAFGQKDGASGQLRALLANVQPSASSILLVVDRLSHQGGLSGVTTGAQTTNLPTAALTRYTSGVGVFAALEIYTQIGTSSTTVTVSYTNQAGTPGQSSIRNIGATGWREVGNMLTLPLAAGDTGMRSIESVNLTGSTGTAGNFGVTLFKPLFAIPLLGWETTLDPIVNGATLPPEILDGACLQPLSMTANASTPLVAGAIRFCED